ncbi:DNA polymerase III subunit chi [Maricaulis sp. CAU 1757]
MTETPAACEVWFYHLEHSPVEEVLPDLLEKTLARGWRALVVSPDARRIERLDDQLWTARPSSFLPHGKADEDRADTQPVLLATRQDNLNQSQILVLLDGAEPEPFDGFTRILVMFDGRDEIAVAEARTLWKRAVSKGHDVSYWRQSPEGRWEKKA